MKFCNGCNEDKGLDEFYASAKGHLSSKCKVCTSEINSERQKLNRDKRREYLRSWRVKNKERIDVRAQKILDNMMKRSKHKGFSPPDFTKNEIMSIIDGGVCCKTGIPFEFGSGYRSPWTPVPDRIDSSRGYSKDNVQWVCHMYNSMKQEFNETEVDKFLDAIFIARRGNF